MVDNNPQKNDLKGKLVEAIVAQLHAAPGVKVEQNKRLPPRNGKGRTRDIDILLTMRDAAGYEVRRAIECKNEKTPIEAGYIEAFNSKLMRLGLTPQHAIYVSASPYTQGAKDSAEEFGIRLLRVTGLSDDRLSAVVSEVLQSVIHVLPIVSSFEITGFSDTFWFYIEGFEHIGTVYDLVWMQWRNGKISDSLGKSVVDIPIPPGWHHLVNGEKRAPIAIKVNVEVIGLVITVRGQATNHALINDQDRFIERAKIQARFDAPDAPKTLKVVFSEFELSEHLEFTSPMRLTIGRLRCPRIQVVNNIGFVYWPVSERTAKKLYEIGPAAPPGTVIEPRPSDPFWIEGHSIHTIWEPIWEKYPFR
jgi:hypothetical protein